MCIYPVYMFICCWCRLAILATQSFNFHRVSRFAFAFAFAFAFHVFFFLFALRSSYFFGVLCLCVTVTSLVVCPAITTPLERQPGRLAQAQPGSCLLTRAQTHTLTHSHSHFAFARSHTTTGTNTMLRVSHEVRVMSFIHKFIDSHTVQLELQLALADYVWLPHLAARCNHFTSLTCNGFTLSLSLFLFHSLTLLVGSHTQHAIEQRRNRSPANIDMD